MSKQYQVSDDAKEKFYDVFNKKTFPVSIKFQFLGSETQKKMIEITKIPDKYSFVMEKDILVTINEDLMDAFDEEAKVILIEQEIDKISMNIDTGKIKLIGHDLKTFSPLINKYGIDKVARANKVEELYQQQVKDGTKEDDTKVDSEFII